MPFVLCADFSLFSDNQQLGPVFILSGMDFQDIPGSPVVSFVNRTNGTNGLQFPDSGIEISLPVPSSWIRLQVGQFNTPFAIEGVNSAGNVIATYAMNKPNAYWFFNFSKSDLSLIRCTGGGHEGVIVSICILVP
jgi:hypothetical protein